MENNSLKNICSELKTSRGSWPSCVSYSEFPQGSTLFHRKGYRGNSRSHRARQWSTDSWLGNLGAINNVWDFRDSTRLSLLVGQSIFSWMRERKTDQDRHRWGKEAIYKARERGDCPKYDPLSLLRTLTRYIWSISQTLQIPEKLFHLNSRRC